MGKYDILGTSFQIGRLAIKNRFCMAPLGGGQHFRPEGGYTDEAIQYYVERAKGGFGLIFTGAIATDHKVDPYTGIGPAILQNPDAFKFRAVELNERVNAYGAKIFAQLTMGLGRNYPKLPAPSRLPVYRHPGEFSPALSKDEIRVKIDLLVKSARIAKESGFAGLEVHSIHWGYLLDQFALAMMNRREDEYGGSLENRLRASREILEGIKAECGSDFPVSMRLGLKTFIKAFGKATLSGEDEMGRTIEEGVRIAQLLESYGYDCLSVDTGTYDSFYYACPPMYVPRGYAVGFAARAKAAIQIPVLAGGRMNDPDIILKAVGNGKIDAAVMGRAALADPAFPNKVLSGRPENIRPCIACNQGCLTRLQQGKQPSCAVNPSAMREIRFAIKPCARARKVIVVGGGVAGMEAARIAALRGHDVELFEKRGQLGGNLVPGGAHAFKKEVRELNAWYRNQLASLPVKIHLDANVDAARLNSMGADVIILSTGSVPTMPKVPGIDLDFVFGCLEAIASPGKIGKNVVVVGGGLVGCEIALEYAMDGKQVTVVERLPEILSAGFPSPIPNAQMIPDIFEKYGVRVLTGHGLASIEQGKVILKSGNGPLELAADSVVIATGFRPLPSMAADLKDSGADIYEIGDGRQVSNILQAVWDGYEVANNI